MAATILRYKSTYTLCVRSVSIREMLMDKFGNYQVLVPQNFCLKRLLSVSACAYSEKPVILSATDIVSKETAMSDIPGALADPSFAELGLGQGWWPVHLVENWFELVHTYTGAPWWMTIAMGTFALRLVTFPFYIGSRRVTTRYTNHAGKLMQMRTKMNEAANSKNFQERYMSLKRFRDYTKEHKVQGYRMIFSSMAMPVVFISCFRALSAMTNLPVPSIATESFLWMSSLVDPDPYRFLPALSGMMIGFNLFASLKWNPSTAAAAQRMRRFAPFISAAPVVLMPWMFGGWSGAFGVYLLTNSTFTTAVGLALCSKKIAAFLNMPSPPEGGAFGLNGKQSAMELFFGGAKERAYRKHETREIRKMLREEKKARKKELKGDPPRLYTIGSEARLRTPTIPDFEKEWRPPKINIYDQ